MFQIKSSGDVLNSLAILLSITGIACQDETVYSYIGCSTVLPPTNDPSDLEGDDQIWYKGGVDTSDIILGYTVSTDSTVNGPAYDVNYSLNNTTAGLIIKEVVAENDDTYYFTQGFHAFEVYLDILDLESVWVNRINVTVNNVTVETPERVSVNVGDMAQLTARTGEVAHAGWPDIIHWTNATGDITESPGFKSFEAETSQLGTFYYSVQSEICNTTSEVYRVILDVEDLITTTAGDEDILCDSVSVSPTSQTLGWLGRKTKVTISIETLPIGGVKPNVKVRNLHGDEIKDCESNEDTCSFTVKENDLNDGDNMFEISAYGPDSSFELCEYCNIRSEGISPDGVGAIIGILSFAITIGIVIPVVVVLLLKRKRGKTKVREGENNEDGNNPNKTGNSAHGSQVREGENNVEGNNPNKTGNSAHGNQVKEDEKAEGDKKSDKPGHSAHNN